MASKRTQLALKFAEESPIDPVQRLKDEQRWHGKEARMSFDSAMALPHPRLASVCTSTDFVQLINLAGAAPYHGPARAPRATDLIFAAVEDVFSAAPLLESRWTRGSWDLLQIAIASVAGGPASTRRAAALYHAISGHPDLAIDAAALREVVHTALGADVVARQLNTANHGLRAVLGAATLLLRLGAPAHESAEAWFVRVSMHVNDSLLLAAERPIIDEDPALWRVQLALAESTSPAQYAVALRLCAMALRARHGQPSDPTGAEQLLVGLAEHLWPEGVAERFTDLIGCPRSLQVLATLPTCARCNRPARYLLTGTPRPERCGRHLRFEPKHRRRSHSTTRLITVDDVLPVLRPLLATRGALSLAPQP
jgi:hypothetical protein